jgi:3',5'-cyclic-AMP phosphodiesterase
MDMSSFIYIADTHIGTEKMGYFQQPPYEGKLRELLDALHLWISENGEIDYVLHGGDMIDSTSEKNIELAADMFSVFDVPVKLCLGNHDLTEKNSVELWMKHAPSFFENGSPYYTLQDQLYTLHIAPNNWSEKTLYWDVEQDANFAESEMKTLHSELLKNSAATQILLTHSPIFGLPQAQTGFDVPYHSGNASFLKQITALANAHDSLKIVLGAHTHMNMSIEYNKTRYLTVSSLTEAPFEFKYFKFIDDSLSMQTISLSKYIDFEFDYDFAKNYVQGRAIDRSF